MKNNRGFIHIIVIILIAVLILSFLNINPRDIWDDYALPILQFIWNAILAILGFVVDLSIQLANQLGIGN